MCWTFVWLICIVLFSILEAMTTALVSVWFVIGSIVACISSLFNISFGIQVGIFLVSSLLSLVGLRGYATSRLVKRSRDEPINSIIGKTGLVEEPINNILGQGRVKIGGESWAAKTYDDSVIDAGEYIEVLEIKGVKAIVKLKHIEKDKETE